jgi:hypothetical protein
MIAPEHCRIAFESPCQEDDDVPNSASCAPNNGSPSRYWSTPRLEARYGKPIWGSHRLKDEQIILSTLPRLSCAPAVLPYLRHFIW